MPRFKLKFDEFFKLMSKAFFPLFGFEVQTEVELFKLPKKMDVLILHTDKVDREKIKKQFSIFHYFSEHNIISFKSLNDRITSENDVLDLVTYTSGYIRSHREAKTNNTTATLLTSRISKTFLKKYPGISEFSKFHFIVDLNMFCIHIVDLSRLEMEGLDSYFLAGYAPSDFLEALAGVITRPKKTGISQHRKSVRDFRWTLALTAAAIALGPKLWTT